MQLSFRSSQTRPAPYSCTTSVTWLRSTELPFSIGESARAPDNPRSRISYSSFAPRTPPSLPFSIALSNATDLQIPGKGSGSTHFRVSNSAGAATISSLWNSPPCTFYEPMVVLPTVPSDPLDPVFSPPPGATKWPVYPGPGFIFGGDTSFFGESLGTGILGAPAHMQLAASRIVKGSTLFVYNSRSGLLFGIFEVRVCEFAKSPSQ